MQQPDLFDAYKRGQSLYGKQGDIIAARYRPRGWGWCEEFETGDPDPEPLWLSQGRRNETAAGVIVVFMVLFALGGLLVIWTMVAECRIAQEQQAAMQQNAQSQYTQYSPGAQYAPYQQPATTDTRVHLYTAR